MWKPQLYSTSKQNCKTKKWKGWNKGKVLTKSCFHSSKKWLQCHERKHIQSIAKASTTKKELSMATIQKISQILANHSLAWIVSSTSFTRTVSSAAASVVVGISSMGTKFPSRTSLFESISFCYGIPYKRMAWRTAWLKDSACTISTQSFILLSFISIWTFLETMSSWAKVTSDKLAEDPSPPSRASLFPSWARHNEL